MNEERLRKGNVIALGQSFGDRLMFRAMTSDAPPVTREDFYRWKDEQEAKAAGGQTDG